jgi:hypothetical protein
MLQGDAGYARFAYIFVIGDVGGHEVLGHELKQLSRTMSNRFGLRLLCQEIVHPIVQEIYERDGFEAGSPSFGRAVMAGQNKT